MKNQKGFATLEIILLTAIISVLAFIAVPKFAQIIDKMVLDYEVKHFYNQVELQNLLNRSSRCEPEIFSAKISPQGEKVELDLLTDNKQYHLRHNSKIIGEVHKFPKNFSIEDNNPHGNSRTIILTSHFGSKAKIIRDSVGRWRVTKNEK